MSDTYEVLEYEKKETRQGKAYGRARLKPGGWVSIWHDGDRKTVYENVGGYITAIVEEKDDFKNLVDAKPAAGGGGASGPYSPSGKDVNIVRQSSWKAACACADAFALALRREGQTNEAGEPLPSMLSVPNLIASLEQFAHQIEQDVLAEDPPEPEDQTPDFEPGAEDDIPF
jgi:hypothetical protein